MLKIWQFSIGSIGLGNCVIADLTATYIDTKWPNNDGIARAGIGGMNADQMRARTDRFSVDIINFCKSLPNDPFTKAIALQLFRSGTSVASNYHAACRAQTRAMFISKISIALEEADECAGWLHKLAATMQSEGLALSSLRQEAHELVAILSASRRTALSRSKGRTGSITKSPNH